MQVPSLGTGVIVVLISLSKRTWLETLIVIQIAMGTAVSSVEDFIG